MSRDRPPPAPPPPPTHPRPPRGAWGRQREPWRVTAEGSGCLAVIAYSIVAWLVVLWLCTRSHH